MSESPCDAEATFSYQSDAPAMQADEDTNELLFTYTFSESASFLGYSKAVLYMSCQDYDDLDVFVQLRKTNKDGKILQNLNIPSEKLGLKIEEVETINPMKYLGPSGILRASHREVDANLSKINRPYHPHTSEQRVPPGTVVKLEIGLWPSGMLFDAGESIVLKVAGHHMTLAEFAPQRGLFTTGNKGIHHLHVGGINSSCIVIPLIA
jgi:predicted acyl esterase